MNALVSQPYGHRDQMRVHSLGKIEGQRGTVKAEMNRLMPGLDRSPLSFWMGGQGDSSIKVLGRTCSFLGVVLLSKLEWAGKPF